MGLIHVTWITYYGMKWIFLKKFWTLTSGMGIFSESFCDGMKECFLLALNHDAPFHQLWVNAIKSRLLKVIMPHGISEPCENDKKCLQHFPVSALEPSVLCLTSDLRKWCFHPVKPQEIRSIPTFHLKYMSWNSFVLLSLVCCI